MPLNYNSGPAPGPAPKAAPAPAVNRSGAPPPVYHAAPAPQRVALPPILPAPRPAPVIAVNRSGAPPPRAAPDNDAPAAPPKYYNQGPTLPPIINQQSKAQLAQGQRDLNQKLLNQSMSSLATAMRQPAPKAPSTGGGPALAAITGARVGGLNSVIDPVGKILGNFINEGLHLPQTTVKSLEQAGIALYDDVAHGHLGQMNLGSALGNGNGSSRSELGQLASGMYHSDPAAQALTGHLGTALKLAGDHPLSAVLDATGAYGLVGRGVGAVSRLGDSTLARADNPILPGHTPTDVAQHFSPNWFTQKGQQWADARGAKAAQARVDSPVPLSLRESKNLTKPAQNLRQQMALVYGPEKAAASRAVNENRAAFDASAKGLGTTERNAVPYMAAFGGGMDTIARVHQVYTDAKAGMYGQPGMHLDEHLTNLQAALDKHAAGKFDVAGTQRAAADYRTRQAALEQQKVGLNTIEQPAIQRELEKQYARVQMPGTHYIDPVAHPDQIAGAQEAARNVKGVAAELKAAIKTQAENAKAHAVSGSVLADASKRLPVHPVNDSFANLLADQRAMVAESRPATKLQDANTVAALKDHLDAAKQEQKLANIPHKMQGLVVEDPTARPLTSGPLTHVGVRPLGSAEIRAHMEANGHDPAFVHMSNPEREVPRPLFDNVAPSTAPAISGKVDTGHAALTGDWLPGHGALRRSQESDIHAIAKAQMQHTVFDRFGVRDPATGLPFTNVADAQHAAEVYGQQHGIKMEARPLATGNPGEHVIMPTAATKELDKQRALEDPNAVQRQFLRVNRAFRNTVLPTSAHLPVMHVGEAGIRSVIAGATPRDALLARAVSAKIRETNPAAANRFDDLAMQGGHGAMQHAWDNEDLKRYGTEHSTAYNVAAAPAHYWGEAAHRIIGAQRFMEKGAQMSGVGVHMRRTLQEFGHSWLDANTSIAHHVDQLAQHYQDPKVMEDAARFVHKTFGQYNNFTALQRNVVSRYMPFAPWYLNAAKLVYKELPIGHPLKSAIAQDINTANQKGWDQAHAGVFPDQQGMLFDAPGHLQDIARDTPFGLMKPPIAEVGSLVLPQYSGLLKAVFAGQDNFGKQLLNLGESARNPSITPLSPQAILHGVSSFLEGVAGPIGPLARAIQSHGESFTNASMPLFGQVQRKGPDTAHGHGGLLGGFDRRFSPFYGVYTNAAGGGAPTGGSAAPTSGPGSVTPSSSFAPSTGFTVSPSNFTVTH